MHKFVHFGDLDCILETEGERKTDRQTEAERQTETETQRQRVGEGRIESDRLNTKKKSLSSL